MIRNFLTPGGILLISTPNPLSLPVIIFEYLGSKKYFYSQDHTYYYLPRWVEKLLTDSGYRLEKIVPVGMGYPFFILPGPKMLSYQLIYQAVIAD